MSYCEYVKKLEKGNVHRVYHDTAYGFSIDADDELFERLVLEINQAGLSWNTILNKQANFKKAYHNFNIKKVAGYKQMDRQRLLADAGIIRNRLKVDAAIHNANVILNLQREHGSFKNWLDLHDSKVKIEKKNSKGAKESSEAKEYWVKLFKNTFKFTGGEIVNEFLMSTSYLPGAHTPSCSIYKKLK